MSHLDTGGSYFRDQSIPAPTVTAAMADAVRRLVARQPDRDLLAEALGLVSYEGHAISEHGPGRAKAVVREAIA